MRAWRARIPNGQVITVKIFIQYSQKGYERTGRRTSHKDVIHLIQVDFILCTAGSEQAIDILEHNGMRIVKSRFATSSCPLCIQKILPGSQVAKQVSDHKRGGWVHVACALKTVNPGPVKHSTKLAK